MLPAISYCNNSVLAELPREELQRLAPKLSHVALRAGACIYEIGERVRYLYFVTGGLISTLAAMRDGMGVEVGTIGSEGVIGLAVLLKCTHSKLRVVSLTAATAFKAPVAVICEEFRRQSSLREALLGNIHCQWFGASQAAACNRFHPLQQRLACRLLLAADSLGVSYFGVTHEFMALMLGAHRPSVSLALMRLRDCGIIQYRRAGIRIIDRGNLEKLSCECYESISTESGRHAFEEPVAV